MSFNPDDDGHHIWNFLHLMSANAVTPEKRTLYVQFVNGLKIAFPCEKCRLHLIDNLEVLPVEPYSNSNISLFRHSWELHDLVNSQLNKPLKQRLTYPQAFMKWFKRPLEAHEYPQIEASNERIMVSNGHVDTPKALTPAGSQCTTCGKQKVQNTPLPSFNEHRAKQRQIFKTKN
jgi:hypothetical protein